ncbi:MAG: hypothetical protein QM754_18425 [Tepidisphaeraceae bacterium]
MAVERKSIYWGESLSRVAGPLSELLGGEGAAVNALADRYAELIRRERPQLTLDEWQAVCDANNGVWSMSFSRETPTLQLIDDNIAERHGVDAAAINGILSGLPLAGKMAVLAVVEAAWASDLPAGRVAIEAALLR